MIEQLFGSKTRVKLLQLFFSNPNRSFFVREITRKIDEQINSVRRELSNLLAIGIITSDNTNNKLYYEVNQKYEYFDPLQTIFGGGVKKTKKATEDSDDAATESDLRAVGHIDLAVYTGQFTRDETAGVDFFIVGEVNPNALQKYVDELEAKENKSLRYTVMSLPDFQYRQQIHDRFAVAIAQSKKQVLVDCIVLTNKGSRIVIDDNLADLGAKSVIKTGDVALFTGPHGGASQARLSIDSPGEFEVADISIVGIPARTHIDEEGSHNATMFKLTVGDQSVLITGHIYPKLSDVQLEAIGMVDLLIVPVGGNGYTVDPVGALQLIKAIEPKLVVPTHYADAALHYPVPQQDLAHALKELAMEPKETLTKLRLKPAELTDVTQLVILEKS
jgi:L-ascorbate metabolism protein UlaG (beta-lactamase superfamily)/predicted transcriptional regulator